MTDPIQSFFPQVVDSTILGAFRSCPQKAFREFVQHWKGRGSNVHLHAGAAYAHGLEVARRAFYVDGLDRATSESMGLDALSTAYGDYECPATSAKTKERMMGALLFYFDNYPLDGDTATPAVINGRHGIEFSFAEPLPIDHPVTGEPLIFSGRCDMLVNYAGGLYLEDDKTTSSLGASWAKNWEMRGQFSGYSWAARQAGISVRGVLVRGVSILKTKYETQQVLTYRAPFEIDRWYDQTCRDLERMVKAYREDQWDYNLDEACSSFGGCHFMNACKSQFPGSWLQTEFEQRVWDPLNRTELPLDQYIARIGQ